MKPRWFRSLIRKNVAPIPKDTARTWRERLSKIYMFMAFNCMGLILYTSYNQGLDLTGDKSKGPLKYQSLAKGADVNVIEIRGMKITKEYHLSNSTKVDK